MTASAQIEKVQAWTAYIDGVLTGDIPACEAVKFACKRHVSDLEKSKSDEFLYRFSPGLAKRVLDFFGTLQLTKALKKPRHFEPELWQCFILAMLFGWVRKDDGNRRFRRAYITVGRKNGKSHLLAGVGLYGLVADGEYGAEVYSVATKKDQARMIFDAAVEFRRSSGNLKSLVTHKNSTLSVIGTGSKFQALSSDEEGMDGLNVHVGMIDEFQNHKLDTTYERITTATAARRQPLILTIGTAGVDRLSPCGREYNLAKRILQGDADDDTYFAYVAEADEEDDWEDEAIWAKANPNLGVSVNIEDLRAKAQEARNEPAKLNSFLRLHLNIWTQQAYVYIPMHRWRECVGEVKTTEKDGRVVVVDPRNRVAVEDAMLAQWRPPFVGLDLSSKEDITALAMLFPPKQAEESWVVTCRFWVPQDCVAKRAKKDRVPYDLWIRDGLITATPGEVVDYEYVKADVVKLHHKLHFQASGCDPWNALMLINALKGEGVPVVEVQQGFRSLSDATKTLLAWTLGKKISHLNDPVLNWMCGNMAVAMDPSGNVKPDKEKARERMDGMAAIVNAIFVALSRQQSIYASRGILTI